MGYIRWPVRQAEHSFKYSSHGRAIQGRARHCCTGHRHGLASHGLEVTTAQVTAAQVTATANHDSASHGRSRACISRRRQVTTSKVKAAPRMQRNPSGYCRPLSFTTLHCQTTRFLHHTVLLPQLPPLPCHCKGIRSTDLGCRRAGRVNWGRGFPLRSPIVQPLAGGRPR